MAKTEEAKTAEKASGNEEAKTAEKASGGSAKTDLVKQHIQAIVKQQLGVKVSKQVAWELFKAVIHGMVEFTLEDSDQEVPLAGVGTFKVLPTKPRKSKADAGWENVPRFRFYPSSVIDKLLEQKAGLMDHGVKEKKYGIFVTGEDEPAEEPEEKESKKSEKKAEKAAPVSPEDDLEI